jgi:hypothetical protein
MASKRPKKPEPISKHIVCSTCGLSWEAHGKEPTLETCVELLKAEVVKRLVYQPSTTSSAVTVKPYWLNTWGSYTGGAN